MATEFQTKTVVHVERRAHPKIDHYFNVAIHVVKRTNDLADESKTLTIRLLILGLVIIHCIAVLTK